MQYDKKTKTNPPPRPLPNPPLGGRGAVLLPTRSIPGTTKRTTTTSIHAVFGGLRERRLQPPARDSLAARYEQKRLHVCPAHNN